MAGTKLVPAFFAGEGEVELVKKIMAIILVVLAGVITFGILYDADGREEAKPQLVAGGSGVTIPPARYTVGVDDTCETIASSYGGKDWHDLRSLNGDKISEEAARRGVSFDECPIQAGWVLEIPASWIPGGAVVETQQVLVNDDWTHWKRTVAFGVLGGIAFGYFLRWTGLLGKTFRWARNTFRNPTAGRFKQV